jgi:hypothetical protein
MRKPYSPVSVGLAFECEHNVNLPRPVINNSPVDGKPVARSDEFVASTLSSISQRKKKRRYDGFGFWLAPQGSPAMF